MRSYVDHHLMIVIMIEIMMIMMLLLLLLLISFDGLRLLLYELKSRQFD